MVIRREKPEEFSQIYDLVKVAFQTAKVTNGQEQDFVNQLRSNGNYIPELALVAEENSKLIGHLMLTKTYIINNGNKYETLLLAPISVVLEYRNQGIGSKLIKESFKLANDMGYTSILLVGDPAYYHRFGFKAAVNFGIKHTHNIPDEYVMACELVPGALYGISGTTTCC
ncbi:MAG: GNAT family acetyltransferase [Desulfotomaculum sp. BICA1-6]|nr:MAG: GNAT family acetyltransferase [Peptococcaceae bacterium BRH_c8a]KJS78670.1 MAG: GNAT family acetyltransferase [Desulfotomaculum sp. BICA1-6]